MHTHIHSRSLLKRTIDSTVSGLKQHIADAEREAYTGQAVTKEWCQQRVDKIFQQQDGQRQEQQQHDVLPEINTQLTRVTSSGKRPPGARKNSRLWQQGPLETDTSTSSTTTATSDTNTSTSTSTSTSVPLDPPRAVVPYQSLLSQLVIDLCSQQQHLLTLHSVALLWTTFITRIRTCWETCTSLPCLYSNDIPDFGYVLVHQKLQLLQRCIRMAQQARTSSTATTTSTRYDAVSSDMMTPIKPRTSSDHTTATPDWHSWNQAWEDGEQVRDGSCLLVCVCMFAHAMILCHFLLRC